MKIPIIKSFIPFLILFVVSNILLVLLKDKLLANDVDVYFIWGANVVIFALTILGYFIQVKGAQSANFNAFLRGIYSSLLLKMFVVIIALVIYISIEGSDVNSAAIFTSMGFYLVYTAIEVMQLMKIVRNKPHA